MTARRRRARVRRPARPDVPRDDELVPLLEDRAAHRETSPRLTGGDVDADWHGAWDAGDEAVGGSAATPDQDVVDEIGEALGVPQEPDAEVVPSREILADRDRHRWELDDDGSAREEEEP
jgi:hypothetical protein